MLLVQLDPVDSQPARAGARFRRHLHRQPEREKFGGEEHLVAPALDGLADDALGLAECINLGSVDERDSGSISSTIFTASPRA